MVASNGTSAKGLSEVNAELQLVESKIKLHRLKRAEKLLENLSLFGDDFGGSDLWDRLRDKDGSRWVPLSVPSDRRHGGNWPFWRTIIELGELRQKSRVLCRTNSYAKGLLKNLTNYIIGKGGFLFKAASKAVPGRKTEAVADDPDSDPAKPFVVQLQGFIDGFGKANKFVTRQREAFRRTLRDGEAFIRLFYQDDGMTLLRAVEPECVLDPPGALWSEGWSYGIQHSMDPVEDIEDPKFYHVYYQDSSTQSGSGADTGKAGIAGGVDRDGKATATGDLVPAEEMIHLKEPDEDAAVKRGTPAFAYDVFDALDRASKLQRNMSQSAAIQAAIAEIQQFSTASQAQVSALQSTMADFLKDDPSTGKTESVERVRPGTIRRIPAGTEFVEPPGSAHAADHLAIAQGDLRAGSTAFCAPEYMTGDASNADYSSTKEASAPFVKMGETDQEHFKEAFLEIIWRAVRHAVDKNRLPKQVLELCDIQAEAPAVWHKDPLVTAQADEILINTGVKDRQTCSMERNLDPEAVLTNNEEWMERTGQAATPMGLPPQEEAAMLRAAATEDVGNALGQ